MIDCGITVTKSQCAVFSLSESPRHGSMMIDCGGDQMGVGMKCSSDQPPIHLQEDAPTSGQPEPRMPPAASVTASTAVLPCVTRLRRPRSPCLCSGDVTDWRRCVWTTFVRDLTRRRRRDAVGAAAHEVTVCSRTLAAPGSHVKPALWPGRIRSLDYLVW